MTTIVFTCLQFCSVYNYIKVTVGQTVYFELQFVVPKHLCAYIHIILMKYQSELCLICVTKMQKHDIPWKQCTGDYLANAKLTMLRLRTRGGNKLVQTKRLTYLCESSWCGK